MVQTAETIVTNAQTEKTSWLVKVPFSGSSGRFRRNWCVGKKPIVHSSNNPTEIAPNVTPIERDTLVLRGISA
jgi:hypothetical protein